ncbi:MAG TPA: metallophosphoesterase [Chthoniobacterales bacterium]
MLGSPPEMSTISRRNFLKIFGLSLPAVAGIDTCLIEPRRLEVKQLQLGHDPQCQFVHFSDLHYRGDAEFAAEVVQTINALKPQFVCFTGDLIEQPEYLAEALSFIRQIETPVYGAPGNHDYFSRAPFIEFARVFNATGGSWLVDQSIVLPEKDLEIVGMAYAGIHAFRPPQAARRLLLLHYPAMADQLGKPFDLILSGHSHGGQIRLPLYGPLLIPDGVGRYDRGLFQTPNGPLYVNAGIGTLSTIPVRWNCPPEITLVRI